MISDGDNLDFDDNCEFMLGNTGKNATEMC